MMRLLQLLLGAAAAAAVDTGLEEMQLSCGNNCVRSGDADERAAWAERDALKRFSQTMPRTYTWEKVKSIHNEKYRLAKGRAVRHTEKGLTGTVVQDSRPGGNRLDVVWTDHPDRDLDDEMADNMHADELQYWMAGGPDEAYDFGVGGGDDRVGQGLGSCAKGLTLKLCPVEQGVAPAFEHVVLGRSGAASGTVEEFSRTAAARTQSLPGVCGGGALRPAGAR